MASVVRQLAGSSLVLPAKSRSRGRSGLCCRASLRGVGSNSTSTTTSDQRQLVSSTDELTLGRADPVAGAEDSGGITTGDDGPAEVEKLHAVAEAAADRVQMHDIISRQRDNWNHLLLHSTNSLALAACVMAALAPASTSLLALKASAGVLLAPAAVTMAAVNKIQPSQLAEEQRNATRLWRQLERDVRATLALGASAATKDDFFLEAMDRVLALDAAHPLPLLPGMLEKFPQHRRARALSAGAFIGSGDAGTSWASGAAVLGGALAAAVNTVEHGGQVGMVFELCRNVTGLYRKIQDDIDDNLDEANLEQRENGELFETKVALQLGRSPSDLRQFKEMASPSFRDEDIRNFAGELF
uniref:F-box protein n=1 Tax=Aegilops tauschii TaxID=37682 RepID=N1R264_AEGTA